MVHMINELSKIINYAIYCSTVQDEGHGVMYDSINLWSYGIHDIDELSKKPVYNHWLANANLHLMIGYSV